MKLCNYCAKQIGYNELYCCDECEKNAMIFFNKEKRSEKLISVINIIGFFGLFIGMLIAFIGSRVIGSLVCSALLLLLGITYLVFPFAPENIIKKYKIKKSIKFIRIVAAAFIVLSIIILILGLFVF